MKKNLLMALTAVTLFASCSKQDNNKTEDNTGKVSLSVKIDMSKLTRSGDNNIFNATNAVPEWDNLLLVVTKATGEYVTQKLYTKAEFAALTGGKATLIEKGIVNLNGGKVTAYITTAGNDWGVLNANPNTSAVDPIVPPVNLPVIASGASGEKDINKWQLSGTLKTGVTGKFENVPYYGSGAIARTGVNADGHELLEATVSVTPELGRIQVINSPQPGGKINGQTVTTIDVTNVYINKVASNGNVIDIRTENTGVNVNPDTWKDAFYDGTDAPLAGMKDATTDKGYQIFDGNTPHVIVEVKYKLTKDGETEGTEEYVGYLTIDKFTYDAITAGNLTVGKGNIYNIDLSQLQPSYDKIGDDPYDNTVYYDLIATVTINPWVAVSVTPGL